MVFVYNRRVAAEVDCGRSESWKGLERGWLLTIVDDMDYARSRSYL